MSIQMKVLDALTEIPIINWERRGQPGDRTVIFFTTFNNISIEITRIQEEELPHYDQTWIYINGMPYIKTYDMTLYSNVWCKFNNEDKKKLEAAVDRLLGTKNNNG